MMLKNGKTNRGEEEPVVSGQGDEDAELYQETYGDLAVKLRVSKSTIRSLVAQGKIPVLRCGKHHRFHYPSVLAALKN